MTRRILTAAVLLLLPAVPLRAADAPAGTKELQGTWEAVASVRDGKDQPPDKGGMIVAMIEGDALTLKIGDQTRTATLKVDATKTPPTMDVLMEDGPQKGKTMKAIYQIKDDELKVCHGEPGADRPTEISSKEGSGLTVVTFKRVKK